MSHKDPDNAFDLLVARYLSEELTPGEVAWFEKELEEDPGKRERLEAYRKIWDSTGSVERQEQYDLDAEWDAIRQKLPGFSGEVPGRIRTSAFWFYRVAAVLVAGLVVAFAWFYAGRIAGTERVAAGNEPVEVRLNDGSVVILNKSSSIRYRVDPGEDERKVFLRGEAWFEVTPDIGHPFIVDAGPALVEVLGTRFNVSAYREKARVEIAVESGLVALSPKKDQHEQIVMAAGSSGIYDRESRDLKLIPQYDPNTISWKTREFYFENDPLKEVAELVSSAYGTQIVIRNPELEECPITVTFRGQSLDAILRVLASTLDLQIIRTNGRIVLDGPGCEK